MSKKRQILYKILAAVLVTAVWQLLSMAVGREMLLASPLSVLKKLCVIWKEDGFARTLFMSLGRVAAGFLIAFAAGVVLAVAAGRFSVIDYLLWPFMVAMKAVPVASFIILCLIWFSYSALTVIITFLIAFPVIYSNVLQGIRSTPPAMLQMAGIYRVPWPRKFLYIYLPSIRPYLLSACSVAIGMGWKAGVAAEVIGVVKDSIGERLYDAKIYFQNADLLAWTIIIIVLSVVTEKVFRLLLNGIFKGIERL